MTRKPSWNINALICFNLLQEHPRQSFADFDEAHMKANKCADSLCVFWSCFSDTEVSQVLAKPNLMLSLAQMLFFEDKKCTHHFELFFPLIKGNQIVFN